MALASRVVIISGVLILLAGCGAPPTNKQSAATPSGPAAAVQTNTYHGSGVVKAVYTNPKAPAIEIDHGDIDGLMPAMQMEFPVTDPNLLNGVKVNDQIDFTIEAAAGTMKVSAIKKK